MRLVHELPVAQHQHLLAGEVLEEVRQLPSVHAEAAVVPERRPSVLDAGGLLGAGPHDVTARLEPVCPQVHPVGVRPVHGIAEDRHQLGRREVGRDPSPRVPVVEVERSALTGLLTLVGLAEQVEVALPLPDPLAVAVGVAGSSVRRRRGVAAEVVLRLLGGAEEQLGVLRERGVECRRTGLGGTDEQEVREASAPGGLGGTRHRSRHSAIVV